MTITRILAFSAPALLAVACSTYSTQRPYGSTAGANDVISSQPYGGTSSASAPSSSASAPYTSDESLARAIRAAWNQDPGLRNIVPQVQVSANNGVITLNGAVPSAEVRNSLVSLARNTPGVLGVTDQLNLTSTAQTAPVYPPPSQVYTPPPQVTSIPAAGGSSGREQSQVLTGSSAVSGQVFSMRVDTLTETDRNLAQRVLQGLQTDTALAQMLPHVVIDVSQGRILLQGTVQSEAQRQSIADAVRRAAGGQNVENQLQVNGR